MARSQVITYLGWRLLTKGDQSEEKEEKLQQNTMQTLVLIRKRKTERELLCVDSTRLKETLTDYKPKHINDWLPELVKDPGLRAADNLHKLINNTHSNK